MQVAYGNLQLFTAALQGLMSDNQDRFSKQASNSNARIKKSMNAIMEQFIALQDILGGTVCGYGCLDTFHSRVFQGGRIDALRSEILSSIEKVCCSSTTQPRSLHAGTEGASTRSLCMYGGACSTEGCAF